MKIKQFTFNMFGVNTYVLWDEKTLEAAIVDPGMVDEAEENVLDSFIERNHLKVTHLINTHLHLDHTFGDKHVMERYGVELEGHHSDEFLGDNLPAQARAFGIGREVAPIDIDKELKEGDKIMLGDEAIYVLHVPGHSPGSLVLYVPTSGFLLAGDVLFKNSIGRSDLAGGNGPELIDGIETKLLTLPPETIVYPGHGPATSIGSEATFNPYL